MPGSMQSPRRSRRPILAGAALLILAVVIGIGAVVVGTSPQPSPSESPTASPTPSPTPTESPSPSASPTTSPSPTASPVATCPMNGEPLSDPALADRTAMLVVIENNPEARPPSGLNLADLVIEAPVEGDTTRFSAIFMCRETIGDAIGTVRSLRYFNVDHFQQLRAVTFNFGGGGSVVRRLRDNGVPFVNGLTSGWPFFFRAGPLAAPHNVFLDVDAARAELETGRLAELAETAGQARAPFVFDPAVSLPEGRAVTSIGIQTASFWRFGWEWDGDAEMWLRTDSGAPNFDRLSGERLQARTVMVQVVEQKVLPGELDPGGYPRRQQFLVGEGSGVLFVGGQAYDVSWSRPAADDVTTWTYEASGEPVVLPPGRVWWEIVPVGSSITEG